MSVLPFYSSNFLAKLTLVSEENGAAVIATEKNQLLLLRPDICDRSLGETFPQILSLDREKPVGSQISEVQHWCTAGLLHQRQVENVSSLDTGGNGIRKDYLVSFIRGDIVNNDGFRGGVGYVRVYLAIFCVIDCQILQTRQRIYQEAQVNHLHDLS